MISLLSINRWAKETHILASCLQKRAADTPFPDVSPDDLDNDADDSQEGTGESPTPVPLPAPIPVPDTGIVIVSSILGVVGLVSLLIGIFFPPVFVITIVALMGMIFMAMDDSYFILK